MRPKMAFFDFDPSSSSIDFEKLKVTNPLLWKKLKKQFDVGRKIIQVQRYNGLDKRNENTLRYYLSEFASRFINYGPKSFPASYNALEPFFVFNGNFSVLQLHPEEESYGVSLSDFLDFVTNKDFDLNKIDFYTNINENIIYNISFTDDFYDIKFSNNGKTFVIGGLSLVRTGNEVSILLQAGGFYDKLDAEEYFKVYKNEIINQPLKPSKKSLGMRIENKEEPKVVFFEGRSDLWAHNVALLFDLKDKKTDIRLVARDENISFNIFTDDFFAIFGYGDVIPNEKTGAFYENQLTKLKDFDAVFDFAKYCVALTYYIYEKEQRIVDVTYETNLSSIIKNPISKREYASVPAEYKIFAKQFYYLESNDQVVIKSAALDDDSFRVEKSGYWKRLAFNEEGFDKNSNRILGKTWVERNDIYYSTFKGITKVEKVENFNNENAGYIYIMRQPAHEENIFKVGLTTRNTEQRRKELSNTSSADSFFVINRYHTKDCIEAEKQIHTQLSKYRLTSRREFFRCDLKIILNVCNQVVDAINK